MSKLMDFDLMKRSAWIGDDLVEGDIKGVALIFHGLGGGVKYEANDIEMTWAKAGFLVVYPYYGGWSWMNREARDFVNLLVDSIYSNYSLNESITLVSTGGSMGGMSSLLFARYSKRPVAACLALYPVCDLKYHYNERPDLPYSITYAFRGYQEDYENLFIEHSPLCQVKSMPYIPYLIIHGDKDTAVNKEMHSDKFVIEMKKNKFNIEYIEVPGMGHGSDIPDYVPQRMKDFVVSFK